MSKGTPSMGKRTRRTHIPCRRCGRSTYNMGKSRCSHCGYGSTTTLRKYSWQNKVRLGLRKK